MGFVFTHFYNPSIWGNHNVYGPVLFPKIINSAVAFVEQTNHFELEPKHLEAFR